MVFFGEYRGRSDAQGRIVIPARLRGALTGSKNASVYITRGIEKCLFLFPETVWRSQSEKLKSLPFTKGDPRAFTRLFFSGASQSNVDGQGRILVPTHLFQYAGIKESVVIAGVGTHVEVWDEREWDAYFTRSLSAYGELAEKLIEQ